MIKIIFFVFVAAGTFFCHTFIDRYQKSGVDMLTDHWNIYASESRSASIKKDKLHLSSRDQSQDVNIQQDIRPFVQNSTLKLSADMKCENVKPGKKPWDRARLILVQHDGLKDRWDLPHKVASLTGKRSWGYYSHAFTIGPETKKIRVAAQLNGCTGDFHLKNLRLFPVTQTSVYTWAKKGILTSWGIFLLFLIGTCFYRSSKNIFLLVTLAVTFIAILIGTTMPGDMKSQVSNEVKTQLRTSSETFENSVQWSPPTIGHFCFFLLFGLVLSLLMNREPAILIMIHILLLAAGTEIAQLYIDGRSPLLSDFMIDAAGGLSAIIMTMLFRIKQKKL